MLRSCVMLFVLMCLTGCLSGPSASEFEVTEHQTFTVDPDDPFITLADGSKIAVDGLGGDQPAVVQTTAFATSNGEIGIDVDIIEQ